ncbi:MAG: hypothetical protein A2V98_00470 [Planctomycetes bacterium RBG_16_64_12]|nr:MAG: hypothetical protein A2V98_00470 [Planctomycetes bacterium RBG_16_64_12]
MHFVQVLWDDDDNPEGNVQHIAEHGLTIEDVEHVLENPTEEAISSATGRPCCFGHTRGGEFIIVVYEEIDEETIYPITAYEVPEP